MRDHQPCRSRVCRRVRRDAPHLVGMFSGVGRRGSGDVGGYPFRRGGGMSGIQPVTTASAALERLPVTRWHWRLVVFAGLGAFFDLLRGFSRRRARSGAGHRVLARHRWQVDGDRRRVRRHVRRRERALGRRRPARAPTGVHLQLARVLAVLTGRRLLPERGDIPCAAVPCWHRAGRRAGAHRHLPGRVHPGPRPWANDSVGLHDRIPRGAAGSAARRQTGGAP